MHSTIYSCKYINEYVTVFTNVATRAVRDGANDSGKQIKQELNTGVYGHKKHKHPQERLITRTHRVSAISLTTPTMSRQLTRHDN